MGGLEEILLALSASESSMNPKVQPTKEWTCEIDGICYRLNPSHGVGCEVSNFDDNFPRNEICFRGTFLSISTLYVRAIGVRRAAFFILPRSLALISPRGILEEYHRAYSSLTSLAFESNSKLT
jgi:hypothetical protein